MLSAIIRIKRGTKLQSSRSKSRKSSISRGVRAAAAGDREIEAECLGSEKGD